MIESTSGNTGMKPGDVLIEPTSGNTRPSSPVRQDGERRTTFLDEYAFRLVPFSRFGSFFVILTSDFQFIDAIINNARCTCHP